MYSRPQLTEEKSEYWLVLGQDVIHFKVRRYTGGNSNIKKQIQLLHVLGSSERSKEQGFKRKQDIHFLFLFTELFLYLVLTQTLCMKLLMD